MDYKQRTLKDQVECTGIGLHSGERVYLNIRPAPSDTGIKFVRTDLDGHPMVEARFDNVCSTMLATTISSNGCKVATIEHLMAAFFGLGIDNAVVELDGPEVPIMDGSTAPFIFLIKSAGIREQKSPKKFIVIKKPFKVDDGNRSVHIYPSKELKITYTIDFAHPLLRNQKYELRFSGRDFVREISRARTFGFLKDVQTLKENGLAKGGSLDNAVVIDDFRIINEDGLRFEDEFVRHKILDFIGDLSIVGSPVIGHFVVEKSGHFLNQEMLKNLMKSKKHWKMLTFETPAECTKNRVKIPSFGVMDPVPA
ncbi:MAG: UDP-3-O-acyl-N-acetylglucosamine deacetylase [Deltaproteobacteria bacterium]|nr:UDP-3-O-acyl-N-acetylglucosamine deacetylase [Deltaproteobacteria bacterium]MBW2118083.1 UDP-3-O-acyl-N-acetylglucosamine deacetylase [Deltaproteobacteria bacterium]MBW2343449.1 UDP-3-O-acyl-N-acetylglucosamine deacetylase [Deltaproteobacteria bacterium]